MPPVLGMIYYEAVTPIRDVTDKLRGYVFPVLEITVETESSGA